MSILETTARFVAARGESMTLARVGEATTISLKGKRIPGTTEAAELLASAWATKVPSASSDTLTVGGRVRTIVDCKPLADGETVALYELEVVG